jgi:hypothetical protein
MCEARAAGKAGLPGHDDCKPAFRQFRGQPAGSRLFADRSPVETDASWRDGDWRPSVVENWASPFARALERRGQYDPARGPALAWLLGIASNLIADAARRGRVEAASRTRLGMEPVELDDEQLTDSARLSACREVGVDELYGPRPVTYRGGTTLG